MAAAEHEFKHQVRQLVNPFEKLLKATYQNHTYPVKHKLKECTMMKNCMTMRTFTRSKKPKGDSTGKAVTPFLEEKAVMLIYDGLASHESCRKLKLTGRAINVVSTVLLEYLHWIESPITFD
jgi:hypothetical protein